MFVNLSWKLSSIKLDSLEYYNIDREQMHVCIRMCLSEVCNFKQQLRNKR